MKRILLLGIISLWMGVHAETVGPTLPGSVESYDRTNPVTEQKPEEYWNLAWHARMADYGDTESQFILAQAYEIGLQTEANQEKAAYFYDKACLGGHVGACMRLGEINELRNVDKALMYFNRAATAGYIPAQLKLVSIYKQQKKLQLAHSWLKRALKSMFPNEKNLEDVSPELAYLASYLSIEEEDTQQLLWKK